MSTDSLARALSLQVAMVLVGSLSQMSSLPTDRTAFFDGNLWTFQASDLSPSVAQDPHHAIYNPSSLNQSGSAGAWVRNFDSPVQGRWAGISQSSSDNYAAINVGITLSRLSKKPLEIPAGVFVVNQAVPNFALQDDDQIFGQGPVLTTLHFTGLANSGEVFSSTTMSRIRLADFKMEASVLQTGGQVAISLKDSTDCTVENVTCDKWTNSFIFWPAAGTAAGPIPPQSTTLRNKAINCISLSSRSYGFFMSNATACEFLHCQVYNASNQDGFKFGGGTLFAKVIGCHAEGCNGDGFDTYDGFISSIMSGCTSYNNTSNGFQLKGTFGGTWSAGDYVTRESSFVNLVARGNALSGFLLQEMRYASVVGLVASENGTAGIVCNNIQGVTFVGCTTFRNTQHGWSMIGGTSRCDFIGCFAFDNSYVDGIIQNGTYDGFNLGSANTCTFLGCYSSNGTIGGKLGGQGFAYNMTTSSGNNVFCCGAGTSVTGPVGGTSPYTNNKFALFDAAGTFIQSSYELGYTAGIGLGGAATQLTSKTTAVTNNKFCGQFTTNNASLAAGARVTFEVLNSNFASTDTCILNLQGGHATKGTYRYWVDGVVTGGFFVTLENLSAGALLEALIFNFTSFKSVVT